MGWQFTVEKPIYIQITERILYDILTKKYEPGSLIPSVRDLAMEAGGNPNTMQRALQDLEHSGILWNRAIRQKP